MDQGEEAVGTYPSQEERYRSALDQRGLGMSFWSWFEGEYPSKTNSSTELDPRAISWVDVPSLGWSERSLWDEEISSVQTQLQDGPIQVEREVLWDLMAPDDGQAKAYELGAAPTSGVLVAKVLAFRIHFLDTRRDDRTAEELRGPGIGRRRRVGEVFLDPIEIGVGDGWVISCCHPSAVFEREDPKGMRELNGTLPLTGSGEFGHDWERTARAWTMRSGGSAADLATLFLAECARGYEDGVRRLRTWVETWELELVGLPEREISRDKIKYYKDQLGRLWYFSYGFRNWLETHQSAGVIEGSEVERSAVWFPGAELSETKRVAARVDTAIKDLRGVTEEIRAGNQILGSIREQKDAREAEDRHRRLEAIAIVFLVPTLVASIFGSNTWVPGQGTVWGFLLVWLVMVILTIGGLMGTTLYRSSAPTRS